MAKLIITKEQYERLIINEQSSRVITENEQSLNNSNDILLGFAKIMGVNLSGFNSHKADGVIKDSKKMLELKNIIQNSDKRQGLIDDLNAKGMIESNDKVLTKADEIANNYNKISNNNGFDYKIDVDGLMNDILNNQ
jgi:hypothetical protein